MNDQNVSVADETEPPLPVAVLSLDREDKNEANLLRFFERAANRGSRLIVVPFGYPEMEESAFRDFFAGLAKKHRLHVVAGHEEGARRIAFVFSPDGELLGETAQTHRLPDEAFEPGNEIRPIATEIGALGLSLGSDIFFPEVHWSLVQQGAGILVHLDIERGVNGHFYAQFSPRVRALDVNKPLIAAAPTSRLLKLVHNEEMGIAGIPMSGSAIFDQNGATLASTGYSQGLALADLRLYQHTQSVEAAANIPLHGGSDIWKLYFNDSRGRYFPGLRQSPPAEPIPKPVYKKRKIRIAVLSHAYGAQIGKDGATILRLMGEACGQKPDIVVATEMEKNCQPDDPAVAETLEKLVAMAREAGSYLLIGGVRKPVPGLPRDRTSHGYLWDRQGKLVFESAIMLYGTGCGQECFDTDFGRIGIRLCGDVYAPELDRLFALKGADIVFNPSMSWGASGLVNTELNQVRAMDNGHYIVTAHLAFSDAGQRSHVIDPTGAVVAASPYYQDAVMVADIDLDSPRGVFVRSPGLVERTDPYLAKYRTPHTHELLSTRDLLKLRRPELYAMIDHDRPEHPFTTRDRGDGWNKK